MPSWSEIWPRAWPWALAAAALLGLYLGGRLARWRRRRVRVRASAHGRRMEERAPAALERHGYRVIERHPELIVEWWVDGEPRTLELAPDLLVARGRRRYLVEVKTGGSARPEKQETRRQLLEYAAYGPVDGVLLYDADSDRLRAVEFPLDRPPGRGRLWPLLLGLLVGLLLGAGVTWWWAE